MLVLVLFALFAMLVSAAVVLYVSFPRRGQDVPRAPWLGSLLTRSVQSLPTVDNRR